MPESTVNKVPIDELLRIKGLKATPQRVAIYDIMCSLGHASADMVVLKMKERNGSTTVATVYNVLDSLTKAGLIEKRMSLGNKSFYDINTHDHCHLYNIGDDMILDYDDDKLVKLVRDYLADSQIRNFDLQKVEINLLGRIKHRRRKKPV